MNQVSTVGLDLAKYIFQLHGADSAGAVVFRQTLRRGQLLAFLATLPPCTVAMEACASAHDWGREIAKLGHTVKLIAPAYVKPFVKRQKKRASGCLGCSRRGGLSSAVSVVVGETWIPALEQGPERAVKRPRARLQQQVGAALGPLHLLTLSKALADYGVDGRLGQA